MESLDSGVGVHAYMISVTNIYFSALQCFFPKRHCCYTVITACLLLTSLEFTVIMHTTIIIFYREIIDFENNYYTQCIGIGIETSYT